MICPKCEFKQSDLNRECARCGIIFEKYREPQNSRLKTKPLPLTDPVKTTVDSRFIKDLFLHVELDTHPLYFGGRVFVFLVIFIWGWQFILCSVESNCTGNSFLHLINLPFHEAGHIFFRPFGRFMTSLGGSLSQLLMPVICLLVLLIMTRDTFAGSVSLWWVGENFMDLAPYIDDARTGKLMLLGGNTGRNAPYGFHDWEFILNELGWLRYDHTLAQMAYNAGIALMFISFVWGGYLLFKQYKNLDL